LLTWGQPHDEQGCTMGPDGWDRCVVPVRVGRA
jgi:hypothetical protein